MTVTALLAVLTSSAVAAAATQRITPAAEPAEWSQYQHDASRAGATTAKGPLWPEIVPGFPVSCISCLFGPAIGRVQAPGGNTEQAIFVAGWIYKLHALDAGGRYLPGWPADVADPGSSHWANDWLRYPVVATDGGNTEIFTARVSEDWYYWGAAYGLGATGQPLGGDWPWYMSSHSIFAFPTLVSPQQAVPAQESGPMLYVASDYAPGIDDPYAIPAGGFLHALRSDGSYQPGWPVRIGDTWLWSGPAVARDRSAYVSSGFYNSDSGDYYFAAQAFARDGKAKPGWPYRFPGGHDAWTTGPSVGPDGTVYAAATVSPLPDLTADHSLIYAFTPAGDVKAGWPVQIEGRIVGAPAVAAHGRTYVSVQKTGGPGQPTTHSIYAFTAAGHPLPGWPVSTPPITLTGDPRMLTGSIRGIAIDGDGNVFFGRGDLAYGYDRHAQPLPGWPVAVPGGFWDIWGPAIAADGTLYFVAGPAAKIYALRPGSPPGAAAARKRLLPPARGRAAEPASRAPRRIRPRAVRGGSTPALRMPTYPTRKQGHRKR